MISDNVRKLVDQLNDILMANNRNPLGEGMLYLEVVELLDKTLNPPPPKKPAPAPFISPTCVVCGDPLSTCRGNRCFRHR